MYDKINNNYRKSWKRTDLKQKQTKGCFDECSQSPKITSALLAQLPHTGLWHFKCPTYGSVCSSFGPALPPSPSAAAAVVASTAYLVPTVAAAFPSMYSA